MVIQIFSKDGKRGITAGGTSLTPEKLTAALVALSSALAVSAIGGLFSAAKPTASHRAGAGRKPVKKKKKTLPFIVAPLVYKALKPTFKLDNLLHVTAGMSDAVEENDLEDDGGVEVVKAIPISSEDEVYDHI